MGGDSFIWDPTACMLQSNEKSEEIQMILFKEATNSEELMEMQDAENCKEEGDQFLKTYLRIRLWSTVGWVLILWTRTCGHICPCLMKQRLRHRQKICPRFAMCRRVLNILLGSNLFHHDVGGWGEAGKLISEVMKDVSERRRRVLHRLQKRCSHRN